MRHGQSVPNVQGVIVSLPENGLDATYGLTEEGKRQARASAQASGLPSTTVIYTSDFSRALQTAHEAATVIGADAPIIATELRERAFGKLEFTSADQYADVWRLDMAGELYGHGVESLLEVGNRTLRLIERVEIEQYRKTILLVSHGDTLQAIQACYQQLHPALDYDKIDYLSNAEIKKLVRVG